ncbi:transmembrane protein 65 [Chloropicon roscoffensis]|uniref:Transmembrane protein 65 n=1 Tax=Chloropicon roscoffensis TaxID=1461544 RepID=A0AAX4PA06_9CHLO
MGGRGGPAGRVMTCSCRGLKLLGTKGIREPLAASLSTSLSSSSAFPPTTTTTTTTTITASTSSSSRAAEGGSTSPPPPPTPRSVLGGRPAPISPPLALRPLLETCSTSCQSRRGLCADGNSGAPRVPASRFRRSRSVKEASVVLVERLRRDPAATAQQLAECLTAAERGALLFALRSQNRVEGLNDCAEAFLEADTDMDGKLSREEFETYWAVLRQERERKRRQVAEGRDWRRAARPTNAQLATVGLASGIPFVGFGFVDNAIMLTAGSEIESSLGVALGITTLAAAGLGNLISDVLGLGLADTIEQQAGRLGVKEPRLAKEQLRMPVIRWVRAAGATVGVVVGCLLGMVPLLFLEGAGKGAAADKEGSDARQTEG